MNERHSIRRPLRRLAGIAGVAMACAWAIAQDPPTGPAAATPAAPASAPATAPSPHAKGPLRVELTALLEGRYGYFDEALKKSQQSRDNELRLQFRVAGDGVGKIVRHGDILLDEVIDETGESMFDPASIPPERRSVTRLTTLAPEKLEENGLLLVGQCKAGSRTAKTIRTIRGSVNLTFSSPYQQVTIVNPLEFAGKTIDHPKLKELGVEAEIIPADAFDPPADPKTTFSIRYKAGAERVRNVAFYDSWMKNLRSRATPMKTTDGRECQQYRLAGGGIDDKSQLVIEVFPDMREETLRFELKDVVLP
jgi:hypothetical protein